jgi:lipopolysaccharide heptosyltransferase I
MNSSPKILIIRLSSLGDILHTVPAFTDLRKTFPDATIDWLVSKKCEFLLHAIPGINRIHILDTDSLLDRTMAGSAWRRLSKLIRELKRERYDFVMDFQGLLKTAFLGWMSGGRTRIGFSKELVRERPSHWFYHKTLAKSQEPLHVLQLNRKLAELAGARPSFAAPCVFNISEKDNRYVDDLLQKNRSEDFVVINPGGGWPTKMWSPEKFGILAKKIQIQSGLPIIVTTGPGEDGLYRIIAEHCGAPRPHHFPVSFLQLIPLYKKARLFIGGDTGPFHLACALGVAVVGIFGPTSPARNGPWSAEDTAVSHTLRCSFCYGRTCSRKNICMDITVDEVFAAAIGRLKES